LVNELDSVYVVPLVGTWLKTIEEVMLNWVIPVGEVMVTCLAISDVLVLEYTAWIVMIPPFPN